MQCPTTGCLSAGQICSDSLALCSWPQLLQARKSCCQGVFIKFYCPRVTSSFDKKTAPRKNYRREIKDDPLLSISFKPINLCWSKPVTCTFQITSSHSRKPIKSFFIRSLQRMWYIYVKHKFDSSSGKSEFEPQSLWRFANFSLFLYCCKLNILDKLNNQQLCISLITERHN